MAGTAPAGTVVEGIEGFPLDRVKAFDGQAAAAHWGVPVDGVARAAPAGTGAASGQGRRIRRSASRANWPNAPRQNRPAGGTPRRIRETTKAGTGSTPTRSTPMATARYQSPRPYRVRTSLGFTGRWSHGAPGTGGTVAGRPGYRRAQPGRPPAHVNPAVPGHGNLRCGPPAVRRRSASLEAERPACAGGSRSRVGGVGHHGRAWTA